MVEKALGSLRDLREYGGPFYHGASTNGLGGVVFGLFSYHFNPDFHMPQTLPYVFLRVLFGLGAGVAYSLGAFCFSLPYIDAFANSVDRHVKSETAKDAIYSSLSLATSLLILIVFAYFLFVVYRGRVPVDHSYLSFRWFISSLSLTNWTEVALIPVSGILLKGSLRLLARFSQTHAEESNERTPTLPLDNSTEKLCQMQKNWFNRIL